jgi:odorant receptor
LLHFNNVNFYNQIKDGSAIFQIFTFMIPMTLEIFLPCYFGNDLSIASSKLSTALIGSEWFECDEKLRSTAKIFMENTKKEMKIFAFGVFQVNLSTFTTIMNSAYSYYNVLKQVNGK